jgi:hypothetical protein
VTAVTSPRKASPYGAGISEGATLSLQNQEKTTMTKMKQILTAALAVAALGTASIAASSDALAKGGHRGGGFHGGGKFFHGGKHFGHHGHHRHWHFKRFYGYGYGYNTCWKYTPYGLVNVCKVWY